MLSHLNHLYTNVVDVQLALMVGDASSESGILLMLRLLTLMMREYRLTFSKKSPKL